MDDPADLTTITTPEDLAALLDGRTDDDINEVVTSMGVDAVLDQVASAMEERFQADRAQGQNAVIQWDVDAPDGAHSFHLTIADGTCTAATGPATEPRVTIGLALADFLRLVAGQLDSMGAFMAGKIKVTGDLMFAQSMQTWFAI
jgi:putative sterol carrier protein